MKFVVVGGGIAGVSCVNEILKLDRTSDLQVLLISASDFIKTVENYRKVGQLGEKFSVKEATSAEVFGDGRFTFLKGKVTRWAAQEIHVDSHVAPIKFDKLCIATGARPRFLSNDPRFLFLRDTESAARLQNRLRAARDILLVGNGGIAAELVYELSGHSMTWMIRDTWLCASFFPEDVEGFIEKRLLGRRSERVEHGSLEMKRPRCHLEDSTSIPGVSGPALGPDWCRDIDFRAESSGSGGEIRILKNCVIERVEPTFLKYSSQGTSSILKPDLIIWATGVVPNSEVWEGLEKTDSGAIIVNDACETSMENVFACGDVCSLPEPSSSLWTQRQLWTQARQLGEVCGRSMVAGAEEARMQNMYFEIFSHCTTFFGMKIVFLGDYKPVKQKIGTWKVVLRDSEEDKLVRCVLVDNKIVGALLIGETDMEETLENLILNKTNLEGIADTFLEPGVDLDDYFD